MLFRTACSIDFKAAVAETCASLMCMIVQVKKSTVKIVYWIQHSVVCLETMDHTNQLVLELVSQCYKKDNFSV